MTVWRILGEHERKPHRIRYCPEKRDPDFDQKMAEVLTACREVSLRAGIPEGSTAGEEPEAYSVSVDGKPGIQAPGLCAPDLPPVAGQLPLHVSKKKRACGGKPGIILPDRRTEAAGAGAVPRCGRTA